MPRPVFYQRDSDIYMIYICSMMKRHVISLSMSHMPLFAGEFLWQSFEKRLYAFELSRLTSTWSIILINTLLLSCRIDYADNSVVTNNCHWSSIEFYVWPHFVSIQQLTVMLLSRTNRFQYTDWSTNYDKNFWRMPSTGFTSLFRLLYFSQFAGIFYRQYVFCRYFRNTEDIKASLKIDVEPVIIKIYVTKYFYLTIHSIPRMKYTTYGYMSALLMRNNNTIL